MGEENVGPGSIGASEVSASRSARKARPKMSAEEKRQLAEQEHRRKLELVQQTLPPVETAFSRHQSPLFGSRSSVNPVPSSATPVSAREEKDEPDVVGGRDQPVQVEQSEAAEPVGSKSVFLREGNDPNRETVYENLASQLREFKKRREAM